MKSQVICDALNAVNPTPAQRARMRAALEAQLPAEKPNRRGAHQQKASSQRWWTIIPAVAALFAVVLLGIFVLGRTDKASPSMSNVPAAPLTLESLLSSANYKASMEIKDYVQSYNATGDVDETLSESYRAYGCRNAINMDGGSSAILWYDGEYITQSSSVTLRYTGGRPLPNAWVYG